MTADQVVGYTLKQTSAITNIVTTGSIYHGLRPVGSSLPCINFYRLAGGTRQHGIDSAIYSINCRATTAATALQVARLVTDLFHGSSGMGTYGYQSVSAANSFEISRASMNQDQGLIPEPEDQLFNAPVDIRIVYPTSTVS